MQFEAKTVEEATKKGLESLGITEAEAEITVKEQPVRGLFGRLKGKAVVEIVKKETVKEETCNLENQADKTPCKCEKNEDCSKETEFLKKLLTYLEIDAEVKVNTDGENETLTLVTNESSSVIGYRGEFLDAMQTLTGAVANIGNKTYKKVVVDCENYRDKREETLIKLAKRLEEKATEMRREIYLEPMNPFERRIIHTALSSREDVKTESEGKEPNRYIVIVPNDLRDDRPISADRRGKNGTKSYDKDKNGFARRGGKERGGRGDRRGSFRGEKRDSGMYGKPKDKHNVTSFGTFIGNSSRSDD